MNKDKDVWSAIVFCDTCKSKTNKGKIKKQGFAIRFWKCSSCGKQWFHPIDSNKFLQWKKLKKLQFRVKLRQVGNSYIVSIPKEIVKFEELALGKEIQWTFKDAETLLLKLK